MNNSQEMIRVSHFTLVDIFQKAQDDGGYIAVAKLPKGLEPNPAYIFHYASSLGQFYYLSEKGLIEIPLSNFGHLYLLKKIMLQKGKDIFSCSANKIISKYLNTSSFMSPMYTQLNESNGFFAREVGVDNPYQAIKLGEVIDEIDHESQTNSGNGMS